MYHWGKDDQTKALTPIHQHPYIYTDHHCAWIIAWGGRDTFENHCLSVILRPKTISKCKDRGFPYRICCWTRSEHILSMCWCLQFPEWKNPIFLQETSPVSALRTMKLRTASFLKTFSRALTFKWALFHCSAEDLKLIFSIYSISTWETSAIFLQDYSWHLSSLALNG